MGKNGGETQTVGDAGVSGGSTVAAGGTPPAMIDHHRLPSYSDASAAAIAIVIAAAAASPVPHRGPSKIFFTRRSALLSLGLTDEFKLDWSRWMT